MTPPAKTILVWGAYLLALGAGMILTPNPLLRAFGFPATNEVWIRALGVVVAALGYYHVQAARKGLLDFFRWSAQGRAFTVIALTTFAACGMARPTILLFALGDLASAIWTATALRHAARGDRRG